MHPHLHPVRFISGLLTFDCCLSQLIKQHPCTLKPHLAAHTSSHFVTEHPDRALVGTSQDWAHSLVKCEVRFHECQATLWHQSVDQNSVPPVGATLLISSLTTSMPQTLYQSQSQTIDHKLSFACARVLNQLQDAWTAPNT